MRSLGQNPTEKEIKEIIAAFDADHDGELNAEEFLVLMGNRIVTGKDPTNAVEEAFKVRTVLPLAPWDWPETTLGLP